MVQNNVKESANVCLKVLMWPGLLVACYQEELLLPEARVCWPSQVGVMFSSQGQMLTLGCLSFFFVFEDL